MITTQILKEFQGTPLKLKELSSYERWALTFFHNEEEILDPNVGLTLQLDITDIEKQYREKYCNTDGASLTAYLYWGLIQAMKKHPCFFWRKIGKTWYHFKSPPLAFIIYVGGKERYNDIMIENVCSMDWGEFCRNYRGKIGRAQAKKKGFIPIPEDIWRLSIFIGNQPDLQFTSLNIHRQKKKAGMPLMYFGKRYQVGGRLMVPFFINFDHSTLDPYVIDLFL